MMIFNYEHKTKPLPHQIDGINYIQNNSEVALFDEQGLGKSKMVIDAIVNNIRDNVLDGAIIVCKKTLLQNWKDEIEIHSYLKVTLVDGNIQSKFRSFLNRTEFYLVCYESVHSLLPILQMLEESYRLAVVLDESQKIKNPSTNVTKSVLELSPQSKKRIIITGTPIANHPEDVWSQFYFLDQGKLLGSDYSQFCEKYGIDYRKTKMSDYEPKLDELRELITSHSLRRTKEILSLPEKEYEDIYLDMAPYQEQLYQMINKKVIEELSLDKNREIVDLSSIDNELVKLLRLIQISSNPKLVEFNYDGDNPKLDYIDLMLQKITDEGEKCIIWTSFISNIEIMQKRYHKYNPAIVHGGIDIDHRNRDIRKFKTDPNCKIMIANPAAAKEGLTLVSANHAVYLDRAFKMDDYLQSQDRIHRIGQTKKCHIYKLICKNTVDEYIDDILQKKELVLKFTVGDIDHIPADALSIDYLIKILGGQTSPN